MNAYTLFQTIHECGRDAQYVEVLNALKAKGCKPSEAHDLLQNLLDEGLISGRLGAYERISLTPKGIARLQELEDRRKNSADIISEKKKNNVFQVMLVLLGGVITLFIEHLPAIIEFISSLLH